MARGTREKAAARLRCAHVARNRRPILDVLGRVLPATGKVLEVASGSGEHAAYFAPRLPGILWQPSDPDGEARRSIAAWTGEIANVLAPLDLDVTADDWPIDEAAAMVAMNLIHIAPWPAALGLMAGAGRLLDPGGVLYLYGAFTVGGHHTAASNEAFDRSLRARDPRWGVRDLADVARAAGESGLDLVETVDMPANNLSVILRKR